MCAGCGNSTGAKAEVPLAPVSEKDLQSLAQKRIFFGHQSVGYNVMDGIKDLAKDHPDVKLNIVETNKPQALDHPAFIHTKIGKNEHPDLKIADFIRDIKNGIGNKADIAFFKFCYIDVNQNSDVDKLFNEYKTTMAQLEKEYPKTQFVHVTMPLCVVSAGWKSKVKALLGKSNPNLETNYLRMKYNDLLRKQYQGKEPIFDLAQAEATQENGQMDTVSKNGDAVPCLVPEYSFDGNHLNEIGRKQVARRLVEVLAKL
jgi:hypothetical protein